jgi:hypothetical protein
MDCYDCKYFLTVECLECKEMEKHEPNSDIISSDCDLFNADIDYIQT